MNAPFFIVGLPRSRTAWLANLLTYGPAFCLHDALRTCKQPSDLKGKLAALGVEFPGNADPSIPSFFPELHQLFPGARYVFIERKLEKARASFAKLGVQSEAETKAAFEHLTLALRDMKSALANQHVLHVSFEDLDKPATCAAIWEYCVPGVPFNLDRWQMLDGMGINVIVAKVRAQTNLDQVKQLFAQAHTSPVVMPVKSSFTTPRQAKYLALLAEMCGGNRAAYAWLMQWLHFTLTWDHIADNDPIDKALANLAFESVLLDWPVNEFWVQHMQTLRPLLAATVDAWRHSASEPFKGWDVYTEVPCAVALILGGREHLARCGGPLRAAVRECFQEHQLEGSQWQSGE